MTTHRQKRPSGTRKEGGATSGHPDAETRSERNSGQPECIGVDNRDSGAAAIADAEAAARREWGAYPPPGYSLAEGVWSEGLRWSAEVERSPHPRERPTFGMVCPISLTPDMGALWLLDHAVLTWRMRMEELGLVATDEPAVTVQVMHGERIMSVHGWYGRVSVPEPPGATCGPSAHTQDGQKMAMVPE